jgi:methionyl-tRNA synthetase
MNIASIFRPTQVATIPSYTGSEIANAARNFSKELTSVKNTAMDKGNKTSKMYAKTEAYANKLVKSAEKGNLKATLKNVMKLNQHSTQLFDATSSPFTREGIHKANNERLHIVQTLLNNKLSLN